MRKLSPHVLGPDWWTAIFSGILAVTAVGALWYARDQIKETREESEFQIKEARQQAKVQHLLELPALGKVIEIPQVGGLHHLYIRKAA